MAKKRSSPAPTICTFCGKPAAPVTWDDPFPRTLWAGKSNDRPLKVASCRTCNNHSNEAILKYFFVALDSRYHDPTIAHFRNRKGKKDLRTFSNMWVEVRGNFYLFPDEQVTAKFVKMFMGIRRHLMDESWFFAPPERFLLFKIDKGGDGFVSRMLPFRAGEVTPAQPLDPGFADMLNEPMQYKFRDFSYEWFANDAAGMAMGLRYERDEYAELGNLLYLLCFVPNPKSSEATASDEESAGGE